MARNDDIVKVMARWNMPPKAKVYEAFSAVADGCVVLGDNEATVTSSNGEKTYKVRWSPDLSAFSSSDSASVWQGYTGYPIIAVLLQLGILHSESQVTGLLAGINWNELNKKFKRDYDKAVASVLERLSEHERELIISAATHAYVQLAALELEKLVTKKK